MDVPAPAAETVRALGDLLARRERTALETVRACRARIEALDAGLGAFVRLDPRAESEAERADRSLAAGTGGPLAGIPIAIKDNLAVAGLETTCGSRILAGHVPSRDATAVARLRAAGAVVIGMTNMDEFGMGSSTETSAYGPARNPWDPARVAGGSSGGSAAAVAARMVPAALGTDTGGSLRQPAAFCGVVGLKPTWGRVSRSGLVAYASSLDQVGPIAATVRDAARVLGAIAGADPDDATTADRPVEDWEAACDEGAAALRVGWVPSMLAEGVDPGIAGAVRAAVDALAEAGVRIEDVELPHAGYAIPTYYLVATAEASSNLARYDGVRFGRRAAGEDGGFDAMLRATRGRGFGAEVQRRIMLGTFALSAGYHEAYYERAMQARRRIGADFDAVFGRGLDAILMPVTPTPAFALGEKLDDPLAMYLSDVFTVLANLAGLPAVSVPFGTDRAGLPLAVQLVGRAFGEASLLRAAAAVEAAAPRLGPAPPGAHA